jgi:hypothetical protein
MKNKELRRFEVWAAATVDRISDAEDRRVVAAYLNWHHLRRLRAAAGNDTLTTAQAELAREQTRSATGFLDCLGARGVALRACTQADIDAWFASPITTRRHARSFLSWATHRRCPKLRIPLDHQGAPSTMSQPERITLVGRLVADDNLELIDRVAGCLVLLYAQPVTRLVKLKVVDLESRGEEVWLRLAGEHLPLPEPLSRLVLELRNRRRNMRTAANPQSVWLFPGRSAGQPIRAGHLSRRLTAIGVGRTARVAAFHQLVREIPAPVVAELLGYNPRVAAARAAELAVDWAAYATIKVREAVPSRGVLPSEEHPDGDGTLRLALHGGP